VKKAGADLPAEIAACDLRLKKLIEAFKHEIGIDHGR
jgi:hypothetical protein